MVGEEQGKELIEQTQISRLLTNYFAAIDDKSLDKAVVEETFTKEAKILRPNGSTTLGHHDILAGYHKSFARFKSTHHVIPNYIIDICSGRASLRANLTAMHLWADNEENPDLNGTSFLAGAVLSATAILIDNTWRISELKNRNVWRIGSGMMEMAYYERPEND